MKDIHKLKDIKGETYIIYKHSITCSVSTYANKLLLDFEKKHPEIPIYKVVVQTDEELKWEIADEYGVKHETPQIIVVKNGKMVASADHYHIDNIEQYF